MFGFYKNRKPSYLLTLLPVVICLNTLVNTAHAALQEMTTNTKNFELKLGATRLIYNPASSGASLSVNNPQDYPILIQGKVYTEDKKTVAAFIVTPPLFRLEAGQQSRLRVIRTGGPAIADRETLNWLCVGGIPPKDTDVWAQDKEGKSVLNPSSVKLNLEIQTNSCIKLLVRPSSLKSHPLDAASSLIWRYEKGKLIAINQTAFYMNLKALSIGDKEIKGLNYIAPFSSGSFDLPEKPSGQVKWRVITDEGGESRLYQSPLH